MRHSLCIVLLFVSTITLCQNSESPIIEVLKRGHHEVFLKKGDVIKVSNEDLNLVITGQLSGIYQDSILIDSNGLIKKISIIDIHTISSKIKGGDYAIPIIAGIFTSTVLSKSSFSTGEHILAAVGIGLGVGVGITYIARLINPTKMKKYRKPKFEFHIV